MKYLFFIFIFSSLFFLIITIFVACSFYASFLLLVRMKAGHWPFNIFFFSFSFSLPLFPISYFFSYDQWKSFIFSSTICFLSLNILFLLFSILPFILNFLPCIFHWFFWITFFYFFSSVILYANLLCEFIWFIFNLYFYSFENFNRMLYVLALQPLEYLLVVSIFFAHAYLASQSVQNLLLLSIFLFTWRLISLYCRFINWCIK